MAKIVHDRANCIGCGACAAICPDFWDMDDDGKAVLKEGNHKKEDDEIIESEREVGEAGCNQDAANACPVDVIRVE